ncbi:MAG: flagellar protein FlgN [Syntrophomonadaceae bacterium]|nr:flagellar protein FlgN [Syntrophomonadaceae bacterium]
MRAQHLDEYLAALEEQLAVLARLKALAEEKREHVVLGRVRELEGLLAREARLLVELEESEQRRGAVHKALAATLGIRPQDLVAARLLEAARAAGLARAEELGARLQALRQAVEALKLLNRENEDLINQSLGFIRALESALTGEPGATGYYSPRGAVAPRGAAVSLIDRKA